MTAKRILYFTAAVVILVIAMAWLSTGCTSAKAPITVISVIKEIYNDTCHCIIIEVNDCNGYDRDTLDTIDIFAHPYPYAYQGGIWLDIDSSIVDTSFHLESIGSEADYSDTLK